MTFRGAALSLIMKVLHRGNHLSTESANFLGEVSMTAITPTIGRKVWFYPSGDTSLAQNSKEQPLDATIVFVYGTGATVNLFVIDHNGNTQPKHSIRLIQPDEALPTSGAYATWMPYQAGQAAAKSQSAAPVTNGAAQLAASSPLASSSEVVAESASATAQLEAEVADPPAQFGFGVAILALQAGKLVARSGWNGKNMFLYYVNGSQFEVNRTPLNVIFPVGTEINYRAHIDMKTADGACVPWVASQSDILASDWGIVEAPAASAQNPSPTPTPPVAPAA